MQFLVDNDVDFMEDPNGFYTTTIRMINPKCKLLHSHETQKNRVMN